MTNTLNTLIILPSFLAVSFSNELIDNNKIEQTVQITEIMNYQDSIKSPSLIRTYFLNDTDWDDLTEKFTANYEMGFSAKFELIDNSKNENISIDKAIKNVPVDYPFNVLFIADSLTFTQSENTVLCVDLCEEPGRFFRVIPSELWAVENNLSIANMDFLTFYESCDEKGIFRGFE